MNIRPLGDRVLVKASDAAEQERGGIIIPDTAQEKPQQGEIVAVGPGKRGDNGELLPMNVKVGETILYGKYGGTEVKLDGEEYLIMSVNDIYGVIA